MEILGDDPFFTTVIKKLAAEELITDLEVKHIKAKRSPAEKGDEITQRLLDKIKSSDNPVQCLLTICDVFESEVKLKKHVTNMRNSVTSKKISGSCHFVNYAKLTRLLLFLSLYTYFHIPSVILHCIDSSRH